MKILIVDDEDEFLEYLEANLRQSFAECEVIRANDGREALRLCSQHTFTLICTDIQMPDLNGLEFSRLVRQDQGPNRAVPIIFISGFGDDFGSATEQLTNTFFVDKPLRIANFLRIASLASGAPLL
ncbi:MAG TPA: response regulator [Oligoflexus sp.]|uniref:response regulator n=1 Tax=Oligoflexus sp. TaxID=1971216 RepID=UPI002D55B833|nr:response regulator [Oligoflexus sp.]HYX38358.1 response regulator [Oligoflexus sp.]